MSSFGIDFGTTNTAVSECLITEFGISCSQYGENDQPFPSLIALHPDKEPLFAWEVKKRRNHLVNEGYRIVASFKSILGSDLLIPVGDKNYSPIDITALFLDYIKRRTEQLAGKKITEAVIAIPVDFSPEQRRNLREAAKRAGIRIKSFVSESTAAYVSSRNELNGASNVAVFDWGGGTLDISLIAVEKDIVSELAVSGLKLGGNDIDAMLARHVHARAMQQISGSLSFDDLSPESRDTLIERVEDVKKRLSIDEQAPIRLMKYAGQNMIRMDVSLDEFSLLIHSAVEKAAGLLYETASKAGIGLGNMDAILMVGGSCEMLDVYKQIVKIGENNHLEVYRPEDVQWAVARGAAILSEQEPAYCLQNSFGVLLSDNSYFPIFRAGQRIPCKSDELCFGVVVDTTSAVFVFADEQKNVLLRQSVPIKGFTAEGLHLQCRIDEDMIAHLHIHSDHAKRMPVDAELTKLAMAYRL